MACSLCRTIGIGEEYFEIQIPSEEIRIKLKKSDYEILLTLLEKFNIKISDYSQYKYSILKGVSEKMIQVRNIQKILYDPSMFTKNIQKFIGFLNDVPESTFYSINGFIFSTDISDITIDSTDDRYVLHNHLLDLLQKENHKFMIKCIYVSSDTCHIFLIIYDHGHYTIMDTVSSLDPDFFDFVHYIEYVTTYICNIHEMKDYKEDIARRVYHSHQNTLSFREYVTANALAFSVLNRERVTIKSAWKNDNKGLQLLESDIYMTEGFCQLWTLFFMIQVMLGHSVESIYQKLYGENGDDLLHIYPHFIVMWFNIFFCEK